MNLPEQRRYALTYLRWYARHERRAYRLIRAWLSSVRDRALSMLEAFGIRGTLASLTNLAPAVTVQQLLTRLYAHTLPEAARREFERLRERFVLPPTTVGNFEAGFFSRQWQQTTNQMLSAPETAQRVTQIAETTRGQIRRVLVQANLDNVDVRTAARRLRTVLGGKGAARRALLIARTETTRAANAGHEAGAMSTGLTLNKIWIATADGRTRDTHRGMLGRKPIPKDVPFLVGGLQMKYPGDPAGGARECVNCRCVVSYVPATHSEGVSMAGGLGVPGRTPRKPPRYTHHADGTLVSKSKTIQQAESWAITHGVAKDVTYSGLTPAIADRLNNQVYQLKARFGAQFESIYPGVNMSADTYFKTGPSPGVAGGNLVYNPAKFSSSRRAADALEELAYYQHINWLYDGSLESAITHEYAHLLHVQRFVGAGLSPPMAVAQWQNSLSRIPNEAEAIGMVSDYAKTSLHETQAEAFVFFVRGGKSHLLTPLERSVLRLIVAL